MVNALVKWWWERVVNSPRVSFRRSVRMILKARPLIEKAQRQKVTAK